MKHIHRRSCWRPVLPVIFRLRLRQQCLGDKVPPSRSEHSGHRQSVKELLVKEVTAAECRLEEVRQWWQSRTSVSQWASQQMQDVVSCSLLPISPFLLQSARRWQYHSRQQVTLSLSVSLRFWIQPNTALFVATLWRHSLTRLVLQQGNNNNMTKETAAAAASVADMTKHSVLKMCSKCVHVTTSQTDSGKSVVCVACTSLARLECFVHCVAFWMIFRNSGTWKGTVSLVVVVSQCKLYRVGSSARRGRCDLNKSMICLLSKFLAVACLME